jgi:hypothetical protein
MEVRDGKRVARCRCGSEARVRGTQQAHARAGAALALSCAACGARTRARASAQAPDAARLQRQRRAKPPGVLRATRTQRVCSAHLCWTQARAPAAAAARLRTTHWPGQYKRRVRSGKRACQLWHNLRKADAMRFALTWTTHHQRGHASRGMQCVHRRCARVQAMCMRRLLPQHDDRATPASRA